MTNSSDSTSSSEETCKRTAIHNPNIAHGLFDFVNILWLYYGKRLQEDENKEYLDKLYTCSIKCIPLAVRFFRVFILKIHFIFFFTHHRTGEVKKSVFI